MGDLGAISSDGDPTIHLVIAKTLSITSKKTSKLPKSIEITFNGDSVPAVQSQESKDELVQHWTLSNEIHVFPNINDSLIIRVIYGKRRILKARGTTSEDLQLSESDIIDSLEGKNATDVICLSGPNHTVELITSIGYAEDILATISVDGLDPLLHAQEIVAAGDLLSQSLPPLRSILDVVPVSGEVWLALEKAIGTLGKAHPFAKAVLTALSIPYKVLKNEVEYKENVQNLTDAMSTTCRCLMDARYHTKIASATEQFATIMKTLRSAALYVELYRRKGRFKQVISAQFPGKLDGYAEDLITQKNNFQMAMVVQIARDVDMIATLTAEEFLIRRLSPVVQQPPSDGCMEGTRVNILREAREWVEDRESKHNIMWIVGAPGAGKSTIVTTLAAELKGTDRSCARFFCKRDVPELRNPRHVWRTLSFHAADRHEGLKSALMLALSEKKNSDIQDESILDHFRELIKEPLETDAKEKRYRFRIHKGTYPVIIIDALDECYATDDDHSDWDSLLDSLICSKDIKAGLIKIIITSRDHYDIRTTLGDISHHIILSTGDHVSDESSEDIRKFFNLKFEQIRRKAALPSDWPAEGVIIQLTGYAAGLFVWADVVVKYVGQRTVGCDPLQRLDDVLSDISSHVGSAGEGKMKVLDGGVDRLYARIIYEAFRHSTPEERSKAKRVLAAVALAIKPIRKQDLVELLSTDVWDSRAILASIESTLRELSTIIPVSRNGELRVCHKTVSDFLLSHERNAEAMRRFVPEERELSTYVIDSGKEHLSFALACTHFMRRFSSMGILDIVEHLRRPNVLFDYAVSYWFSHLELVNGERFKNLKCLAKAIEIGFGRLQSRAISIPSVINQAEALVECLHDAADFLCQYLTEDFEDQKHIRDSTRVWETLAMDLDTARGRFQEAVVLKSASDHVSSDAFLRSRLDPSDQAQLDSECYEGTRVGVLKQAQEWIEGSDGKQILWVYGAPGAGKSAFTTTLSKRLMEGRRICTKIVAKRDFSDRRDPRCIWRTLMYQLAGLHVGLKGSIMEKLFGDEAPPHGKSVEEQFRELKNLVRSQQYLEIVIMIDALDECFIEDNEDWRALLRTFSEWPTDLPALRLLVTSRDIPEIRNYLQDVSDAICLTTGAEASDEAKKDTEIYLQSQLRDIHPEWLTEDLSQRVIAYASGSFIWAKMIVGLVMNLNSASELEAVLNGDSFGGVGDVDLIYGRMLLGTMGELRANERHISRSIIAMIVLAKDPLRKRDLVDIVCLEGSSADETGRLVERMVEELSSIISVDDDQLLRIPHKSFTDFLLDRERSSTTMDRLIPKQSEAQSYLIVPRKDSGDIAVSCLTLLNKSLTFNVGGIKSSYRLNKDLPELQERVSKLIGTSLIYATRFWTDHLIEGDKEDPSFRAAILAHLKTFLYRNLLHWLEVSSLVKSTHLVEQSLSKVIRFLENVDEDLKELATDAKMFVARYATVISLSVPHIYLSALAFCPSESRIYRVYGPQYPKRLSVTEGRGKNWDINVPPGRDAHKTCVFSVAYFPRGGKLASASDDATIRLWNPENGESVSAPFTGHNFQVWCVKISRDGKRIASSSSDGTFRIWDSITGECIMGPINPLHTKGSPEFEDDAQLGVHSIAISPDGTQVAVGAGDHSVQIWDIKSEARVLGPLLKHTNTVRCVDFSPDGMFVASGSEDETVCIWDTQLGDSNREPIVLTGHAGEVRSVVFSPDGLYLVTGSEDSTIRIWDVKKGFIENEVTKTKDGVSSLSFSSDSRFLVSGSRDGYISFWGIRSGKCEQVGRRFFGHTRYLWSVAFAPDGRAVASCSYDLSVKIWSVPLECMNEESPLADQSLIEPDAETGPLKAGPSQPLVVYDLSDDSYINKDGWMCDARMDEKDVLFYVPIAHRGGIWWKRNTAVIHTTVTKFDFSNFVHGDDWTQCRASITEVL